MNNSTVGIILTVPHSYPDPEGRSKESHLSDYAAASVATSLYTKIARIPYVIVDPPISADVNRSVCDLNRRNCGTDFHDKIENQIRRLSRLGLEHGIWLFDIHSFSQEPNRPACYAIMNHTPTPQIRSFEESIQRHTGMNLMEGGTNYIINSYGQTMLNGQSLLFEFSEAKDTTSCVQGIVDTIREFFLPKSHSVEHIQITHEFFPSLVQSDGSISFSRVAGNKWAISVQGKRECEHTFDLFILLSSIKNGILLCPNC